MSLIHLFYLFTFLENETKQKLYLMVKKPQYLPNLVTRRDNDKIPLDWLRAKIISSYPELKLDFNSVALSKLAESGNKKFIVVNIICQNKVESLAKNYVLVSAEGIIKYLNNQQDLEFKVIAELIIDVLTAYEKNRMFLES